MLSTNITDFTNGYIWFDLLLKFRVICLNQLSFTSAKFPHYKYINVSFLYFRYKKS